MGDRSKAERIEGRRGRGGVGVRQLRDRLKGIERESPAVNRLVLLSP